MSSTIECVILYRNTSNGRVGYVSDGGDEICVFENEDAAIEAAGNVSVCRAYPYQIVPLDEL